MNTQLAKMLIASCNHNCSNEILSITAMLSGTVPPLTHHVPTAGARSSSNEAFRPSSSFSTRGVLCYVAVGAFDIH
jgi:HrpA-like RNA helicase